MVLDEKRSDNTLERLGFTRVHSHIQRYYEAPCDVSAEIINDNIALIYGTRGYLYCDLSDSADIIVGFLHACSTK